MSAVDLGAVSRTARALLDRDDLQIEVYDAVKGRVTKVTPETAAAPDGFLPALIVAGERIWQEATKQGFKLDVRVDPDAVLGYRIEGVKGVSFATVMLSTMEAAAQATHLNTLYLHKLTDLWEDVTARLASEPAKSSPAPGAAP